MAIVNQVRFCILVFILNVCLVCSKDITSPCPDIFNYYQDDSGIYGKIVIKPNGPTSRLAIEVKFTVAAYILDKYSGTLTQENNLKNYNNGQAMVYRLDFPVKNPVPRITDIIINDQTVCSGPGDTLETSNGVTSYSLKHSSYYPTGGSVFTFTTTKRPTTTTTARPEPITYRQVYQPPITRYYPPLDETTTTERPRRRPENFGECGTRSNVHNRIALIHGGDDYERGQQPWLVAIYEKSKSNLNFKCGGTLVSSRHVVTAAHCMKRRKIVTAVKDMIVKLGVHRLSEAWEDNAVITSGLIDAKIHEEFDPNTLENDILILILSKPVTFNSYIRPACLWDGNIGLGHIVDTSGVVAGWGEQNKKGGEVDIPKLVHLPIVSTEKCRSSNEAFVDLTSDKTFCAGDQNGKGPCSGDSGGGMYLLDGGKWRLRGIVSVSLATPTGSCNNEEYAVFTDTAKYLPWIRKVLSIQYFD